MFVALVGLVIKLMHYYSKIKPFIVYQSACPKIAAPIYKCVSNHHRLDPTSMENKKGTFRTTPPAPTGNDAPFESIPKHQHNTAPQHLRLLQYGLKIPNNQHQHQINNQNLHQHLHQPQYPPVHRHLSPSTPQYNTNIHANPMHQHFQQTNQQYLLYQKSKNQPIYQSNPNAPPPPPLHPHNPLNQQNPQIWVPHQPPVHYHQQKAESQQNTPTASKPARENIERKKSSGNNQQLRSPSAKRPLDAPVTLQGWLHKQGSEGLMLWKKRWFVLSEYCLFYYKGPEEEKLLGSILLPSYKVSICGADDKVNKKFAFKCEHTNMRTYILAADSQELMMQWIRVLNLACLLQTNIESESSLMNTSSSTYNQSNDNSDSGFNQQYNNTRNTPIHMHSSSNTTDLSNPSQELSQYNQPLYANAPPKPRRLTDGYQSPSPDVLDRYNEPKYVTLQPPYMQRSVTKSPSVNIYGNQEYLARSEYSQNLVQNAERRTPDTYGRSKSHPIRGRHPSDYEDVYQEQYMYKRPLSPLAYNNIKKTTPAVTPIQRTYTPVSMLGPKDIQYVPPLRKSPSSIPRPHSADFLEYEVNHRQNNAPAANRQPRPKSSLDINRNASSNDNYFYSEERYAEKMRKSAQYLPKMPKYPSRPENDNTFPLMRSNTQPMNYNNAPLEYSRKEAQPIRSRSVLSEGSLSKELDVDLRISPHDRYRETLSPTQDLLYGYDDRMRDYDPFTRSASARLANIEQRLQGDGRASINKEGERKREESMKRLLEWKQRMLQSPLNRKMNQNTNKSARNELYYKNQENGYGHKLLGDPYVDSRRSANPFPQYNSYSSDDEASGSISLNTRDTFPRNMPSKRLWPINSQTMQSKSTTNINRGPESDYSISSIQGIYPSQGTSQHDLSSESNRKVNWNEKMNVSAGDLLGRTHEELVLLLIQLRRQSTNTCHSIEACYNEIDSIQAQQHLMDAAKRLENLQKLEQIKQHLLELEKQYEKGKPLVNLVDNMVKLGSLYRSPNDKSNHNPYMRDRLEFNQQMQERRLLAEERRDWNRLNPNHSQLQEKVQQLYQLDRLIHEESGTLQGLQQDKEEIERALGGLRLRLTQGYNDPAIVEQARKQQAILENELSRVHLMLAQNSKKLEETVAGNARLEQELLVLKQKLQTSRQNRSSPQCSNAGDSLPCVVGTSAMLESDLQKVQQKVGDLQRQRQELSMQVRQLTDRSNNLQQQIKPFSASNSQSQALGNKKKMHSLWRETDLDTMNIIDHGDAWETNSLSTTPLYINTDFKGSESDYYNRSLQSDSTSEDANQNLIPQEKQEIKTVRIVKRESERRQRDREKSVAGKWDTVMEEDDSSQNSSLLFRPSVQKAQSSTNDNVVSPNFPETDDTLTLTNVETTEETVDKSSELSPVFKSEAARQIITEMSNQDTPKQVNRRAVPKEKRRHYTAPHNNLIMKSLNQLPTDDTAFDKATVNTRRARDDLDMERALRQRIDAPDVVRSTLSNKELKYNESTIDNLLGTPNKINIPERYIPEQLPQLSAEEQEHRLRKVESIKKMLSDTTIINSSTPNLATDENSENTPGIANKATTKMIEEKKQREHLLQLNQILAKQVMEMSKIVAGSNNPGEQ